MFEQVGAVLLDEFDGLLFIPGGKGMINRFAEEPVLGEPLRCPLVEFDDAITAAAFGAAANTRRTDDDTEPLALVIDPAQEQIPLFDTKSSITACNSKEVTAICVCTGWRARGWIRG